MEHAVRLDGERLLGVLESAVRNLELLATLPDRVPASDDFQPPVREALRRQVTGDPCVAVRTISALIKSPSRCRQSVIEAGLLRLIEQQSTQQDERPETEEDGDSDADEEELQHHSDETLLLSGPVAVRLFPKSLHQLLRGLKVSSTCHQGETCAKLPTLTSGRRIIPHGIHCVNLAQLACHQRYRVLQRPGCS